MASLINVNQYGPGSLSCLVVAAAFLLSCSSQPSFAADNAQRVPIVVELFTSEGCSSCPPADSLLRKLDSTQPIAGAHLIVLEEHVDYWDDLGWKDPFSSSEYTLRQSEYARRLHVRAPYTPQMVVNGSVEVLGSDDRRAASAFNSARSLSTVEMRFSNIRLEDGKIHAHLETAAVPSKADIYIALALDHADTQVKRGENGGRHLEHVGILLGLGKQQELSKGESFARDVTIAGKSGNAYRLIAFIQEPDQGRIIGATSESIRP